MISVSLTGNQLFHRVGSFSCFRARLNNQFHISLYSLLAVAFMLVINSIQRELQLNLNSTSTIVENRFPYCAPKLYALSGKSLFLGKLSRNKIRAVLISPVSFLEMRFPSPLPFQRDGKFAASVRDIVNRYVSVRECQDPLYQRQTESMPFLPVGTVRLIEFIKDMFLFFLCNTRAPILLP